MSRAKRANLKDKVASVALSRNGLTIEIAGVAATDAGLVAAELLRTYRDLIAKGYVELIADNGSIGAGAGIEIPEEVDGDTAKQMGFTVRR